VRPPGSKSLANRALLLAALAAGDSTIRGAPLDADDTRRMVDALRLLGAGISADADGSTRVRGVHGRWRPQGDRLDLGNAGTATRFLAAASLLAPGPITIDGNERMRQRPIAELIDVLHSLGAEATYEGAPGCPPVRLTAPAQLPRGANVPMATTLSSQFISGLLLIAPWLPGGLTLRLSGEITSRSYIQMTLGLLDLLGASVRTSDDLHIIRVSSPDGLAPFSYTVEPDASGATYFWAAAAMTPGAVCRVEGLDARSLQGDARFPEVLARMGATVIREEPSVGVRGPGALAPIMADLSDMPDTAMTLAAVACFATGRSVLRGLRTLRVKETDRIAAMQKELAKIGVKVETNLLGDADAITITPPTGGVAGGREAPAVVFDTYDDHRMAMALSLIGLRRPNVAIRDPRCVAKTYPGYWSALASAVLD
jgi:3-phosphoshikimate 1-carboxyvinyltransferase